MNEEFFHPHFADPDDPPHMTDREIDEASKGTTVPLGQPLPPPKVTETHQNQARRLRRRKRRK